MQAIRSLRVVFAVLLGVALSVGALQSVHARQSRQEGPKPHELYSQPQLSQSLAPCADLFPGGRALGLEGFSQMAATGLIHPTGEGREKQAIAAAAAAAAPTGCQGR